MFASCEICISPCFRPSRFHPGNNGSKHARSYCASHYAYNAMPEEMKASRERGFRGANVMADAHQVRKEVKHPQITIRKHSGVPDVDLCAVSERRRTQGTDYDDGLGRKCPCLIELQKTTTWELRADLRDQANAYPICGISSVVPRIKLVRNMCVRGTTLKFDSLSCLPSRDKRRSKSINIDRVFATGRVDRRRDETKDTSVPTVCQSHCG